MSAEIDQTLSVALALTGAMLFGASALMARFGLMHTDARNGSLFSNGVTTLLFLTLSPFFLPEVPWSARMLWPFLPLFALIGVFAPGMSLALAFEGNRRLGPTISGTLASTAPVFGVAAAVLLLGERPGPQVLAGAGAVMVGVMAFSWQGRISAQWPWWALLFPVGAALLRGGSHMASRYGLSLHPAPFTAAVIIFIAAMITSTLRERMLRRAPLRLPPRAALAWFAATGLLNGGGALLMSYALVRGQVYLVSPIVSSYPFFTYFLSMAFRVERLGLRAVAGMVLVVGGVAAIGSA